MGTPEFPNLGKHCSIDDCRLIDFLPFTCDCCNRIFCLDHRSHSRHQCPKGNKHDVTVVICPLCAKGVRLNPDENPNITWESHVNIECDPSNFERVTKKKKCPVPRCKETLTFSNTVKCRDCSIDHCLKHRFGLDHNCPAPKKPNASGQSRGSLNKTAKDEPNQASATSSWANFLKAAEAGIVKLSNEFNQALGINGGQQSSNSSISHSGNSSGKVELCPYCSLKFSSGAAVIDHVDKVHKRNEIMKATLDVCPKCSKGFRDPVSLVEHVEKEHKGVSKA